MNRFFPALFGALLIFFCGCNKPSQPEPTPAPTPEATPSPVATPPPVINVGVFLPLRGLGQGSANEALNGLVMAAEEVNAGGGVIGHVLRLVVRDTRAEPARAEKAVRDRLETLMNIKGPKRRPLRIIWAFPCWRWVPPCRAFPRTNRGFPEFAKRTSIQAA